MVQAESRSPRREAEHARRENPHPHARGGREALAFVRRGNPRGSRAANVLPIRHAELGKTDWKAVDLTQKVLTVDNDIAKTKARRVMSIPDNVVKILEKCKKQEGRILLKNYPTLFDKAKIAAGFFPTNKAAHDLSGKKLAKWPKNVLRHSAISYTLAQNGDIYKTATSAGNSPAIVQEHYLQLVKPNDAAAYFAITA